MLPNGQCSFYVLFMGIRCLTEFLTEINSLFLLELNIKWLSWSPITQPSINKDGLEFEIDDVVVD